MEYSPQTRNTYANIMKITAPLLMWSVLVSMVFSADYVNMIFLSKLIWPGESFHAFQMGALISIRLWTDGLFALIWGYFVDRIPRKKMWVITASITGVMVFTNGLLPVGNGNSDFIWWFITKMFIGMFMSAGGPMVFSLVSDMIPKNARSKYFGLNSMIWGLIPSLLSVLSAFAFQNGYWRFYYKMVGIIYLGYAVWLAFFFKEPKRAVHEKELRHILTTTDTKYDFKLNKKTVRSTIFSKTNLLVFGEGIFSGIFFGIMDLVLLPYIQDSPRNLSASNSALLSFVFGIPGALIGPIVFGKLGDKLGTKNIKHRITMIIFSLIFGFSLVLSMFLVKLPHLTVSQGSDVAVLWEYPAFAIYGLIIGLAHVDFSAFQVNQPAIIQEINLPEAQGTIASWGQLIEIASYGSGPLLAGFLLSKYQNDYVSVIFRMAWLLIPGVLMWVFTYKTINRDRIHIQSLLKGRAVELEKRAKKQQKT